MITVTNDTHRKLVWAELIQNELSQAGFFVDMHLTTFRISVFLALKKLKLSLI